MRNNLFSKVAVTVVSFAIPVAMAGPAGAAVANDQSARNVDGKVVELAEHYGVTEQQLTNVDPRLVQNVQAELERLPTDALRSNKMDPNAVEPNLLDGLLAAVAALLEGLGLGDLLPEVPEAPELPEASSQSLFGNVQEPGTLGQLETTTTNLVSHYQAKGEPTAADLEELEALWQQLGSLLLQLAAALGLDVPDVPDAPEVP